MATVRCKCGRWTNYGLTCSMCRTEAYEYGDEPQTEDPKPPEGVDKVVESEEIVEEIEDDD